MHPHLSNLELGSWLIAAEGGTLQGPTLMHFSSAASFTLEQYTWHWRLFSFWNSRGTIHTRADGKPPSSVVRPRSNCWLIATRGIAPAQRRVGGPNRLLVAGYPPKTVAGGYRCGSHRRQCDIRTCTGLKYSECLTYPATCTQP